MIGLNLSGIAAARAARMTGIFSCVLLLSLGGAGLENSASGEPPGGAVQLLEEGRAVEGKLSAVQQHVYWLVLSSGQLLRFRVAAENPGSNLQVTLFGPDDSDIEELSGPVCPFSLYLMPVDSGTYRL